MRAAHLPLQPRCGACADPILRHERVVALSGNEDSTTYDRCTRPFPFPQHGMVPTRVDDLLLCRRQGCSICARAPEFVPVHYDCYEIYMHESDLEANEALSRLWVAGSWRSPWPKAPLIHLSPTATIDQNTLKRVAEICGIPELSKLPPELLDMIRHFSRHELLWRSIVVIRLAAQLSTRSAPLMKVPLDAVSSWERGGKLIRNSSSYPPWVRLTIDPDGISKVERLSERPPYGGTVTERQAFIVAEDLTDINTELKDGLLRLCVPRSQQTLQIWNTPAPPDPATCTFRPVQNVTWQRLHAVDLDRICGLTFLFVGDQLYGIHIHRSKDSCALDTCERFSNRRQLCTVWFYLPIAPKDRVLVLGTRMTELGFNVLVRTQLIGDVILGRLGRRSERDRLLGSGGQITLVYGEPEDLQPVSIFGASCTLSAKKRGLPPPFSLQDFQPEPAGPYFSWAPLSDVLFTRTFYDEDTGLCRGIVLCYENGGSRAVGQCRLHVDPSISVVRPTRLCFQVTTYLTRLRKWERGGVRVEFGGDGDGDGPHRHGGEGWECLALRGVLQFSFTDESSHVAVRECSAEE